jgi:predicted acetyltransferase
MDLEIVPASDCDYATVRNLARFYMYDMAEHADWAFAADGDFDIGDAFNPYWGRRRPSREWPEAWKGFPFLTRVNGHLAGFALVTRQREQPPRYDMGEFFVARQYRGRDLGRRISYALFDRFAGEWVVRQLLTNVGAQSFWRRIIGDYTGGKFAETQEIFAEHGGKEFVVQRFVSRASAP